MKKYTKVLALALALTMMLSMSVFAAGKIETCEATNGNTTIKAAKDETTVAGNDKFGLTYDGGTENKDAMYLLLVLDDKGYEKDGVPTAGNIKYVNQATADALGVAAFDSVYPSDITDSTVYLAGGSLGGLTKVALLNAEDPEFDLGDVNLNGDVDMDDVVALLRHVLNAEVITNDTALDMGEVEIDGDLDMDDVVKLMKYVLNAIDSLT